MSFPDFNQAFSVRALHRAMQRAMKGHRGDPEAAAFLLEAGPRLCDLSARLLARTWRPSPYRTFPIRDPKPRTVAVVDFADRVVHHALVAAAVGHERSYVAKLLNLTLLSPAIVHAALAGDEPSGLSVARLRQGVPASWTEQQKAFR
jgi:hypothetical protein